MSNAETLIAEDFPNQRRSHVVIVHDQHRAGHRGAIVKAASIGVYTALHGGLHLAHANSSGRMVCTGGSMTYALRYLDTAALVRNYEKDGAALAFLRDVVRLGSRDAASRFLLSHVDEH